MITQFRTLATVRLAHAYNRGVATQLEMVLPAETARIMRRGRMLARTLNGVLHFIYEADESGAALAPLPGATLRVGVRVLAPSFENVTDPASLPGSGIAHWRNAGSLLSPFTVTRIVGSIFEHALGDAARPVTVSVRDATTELWSEVVTAAQGRSRVSIDLSGFDPGPLTLREAYAASVLESSAFLHSELVREDLLGVLDINLASSFYTTPAAFEIAFGARAEVLRYYLVVDNHSTAELATLTVEDLGFAAESRAEIEFTRDDPPFDSGSLPTSQLGGTATSSFVLFRSNTAVPRQAFARRRIELHRNGDVLIQNLPQPRPDQPDANIVIHIGK
jgi:hypothetical protein